MRHQYAESCRCNSCDWRRNQKKREIELSSLLEEEIAKIFPAEQQLRELRGNISEIRRELAIHRARSKAETKRLNREGYAEFQQEKARKEAERNERLGKVKDMRDSGLTFSSIAELLGVSVSRAKSIYEQAKWIDEQKE